MNKIYLLPFIAIFFSNLLFAKEDIQPTIQPSTFTAQTTITVTYDVTGTPLANLSEAYLWVWVPTASLDAKYNVNPASSDQSLADNAKFTKNIDGATTTFSITFKPQDFFSNLICPESQLGVLLKGNDWSDGQTTDHLASMTPLDQCFVVNLTAPIEDPAFIDPGGTLSVKAKSSMTATFTLEVNGSQVDQQTSITDYAFNFPVPQSSGIYPVELYVTDVENDTTITFSYLVNSPSEEKSRPTGIIPGINYDPNDDSKATVCLYAPGKNAVYLLGEFNNFEIAPANKIYRDGDYFWGEVTGLTPGTEYAYQYLVDGVFIADPFADKILDPLDKYIAESIYPNLKSYPKAALRDEDYKNRLSIIQTGQTLFNWQHATVQHPDKKQLTIYELLVRDFFAADDRNYLNLIDTLSYLKRLGVNAIELMPIMEFSGNDSWGYNPTFMFAPDKAYGTKNALKKFIDAAHSDGFSVILDIVFNHQELPNPYVAMWFNFNTFKVRPDNPMFNVEATHDYSVFYDMNHESPMTQYYVDTTLNYWINQYKVDGFRFDLSKGFTQKITKGDVNAWGQYDASRIQILERIANKVWSYAPNVYLILEHFAENKEEKELANYGFMLWGNEHNDYKEAILGYPNNADFNWAYYQSRDWNDNNLVSYYESHDEQRQMYEGEHNGNSGGNYNVKDTATALNRMKLAAAFLYTIPGPKLCWQFGELGYDYDIEYNGRTSAKPIRWDYYQDQDRRKLFKVQSAILNLRNSLNIFIDGTFTWKSSGTVRYITLKDNQMAMVVVGNFDVGTQTEDIPFTQTGTWYDLFSDKTLEISGSTKQMTLEPGEFHILTSQKIQGIETGLVPWWQDVAVTALDGPSPQKIRIYPNPAHDQLNIETGKHSVDNVQVCDFMGKYINNIRFQKSPDMIRIDTRAINPGLYLLQFTSDEQSHTVKMIIQ